MTKRKNHVFAYLKKAGIAFIFFSLVLTGFSCFAAQVSWWKLDSDSGLTATDSTGTNSGTLENGPGWTTTAVKNRGLSFDTTDDLVSISDSDDLDDSQRMTFIAWVRPVNLDGNPRALLSKRSGADDNQAYSVFFYTDDKLYVDIDGTDDRFSSNTVFSDDTWYHIAVVYNGAAEEAQRVKVYVNGSLDITASETSSSIPNYSSDLYLGTMNDSYGYSLGGNLDEVKIYDSALSQIDIQNDYALTKPAITSITPDGGPTGTLIDVTVSGSNFQAGSKLKLIKSGQTDIDAYNISVTDSSTITCRFSLAGAVLGDWDLKVTGPTTQFDTFSEGFTVYNAWVAAVWKMDDGSGDTVTDTQSTHDGTRYGASWTSNSAKNYALEFGGTSDYVSIDDAADLNTSTYGRRTIMLWFKADTTTGRQVIWEEGGDTDGLNIYIDSGNLYSGIWSDTYSYAGNWISTAISSNTWYHLALIVNNGTMFPQGDKLKGYLNGTEFASGTGISLAPHPENIGMAKVREDTKFHDGTFSGDGYNFDGNLDEVKIYNAILTPAEIQSDYELTLPGITGIDPAQGIVGNSVDLTITGTNFYGSSVKLTKSGQSDINGISVVVSDPTTITCTFDLSGAVIGDWNVVVTNNTGQTGTLTDGFEVFTGTPVSWWKMDEGANDTVADTEGSNDGTRNNATWSSSAASENCLVFDGSGDYVDVADDATLQITGELSVTAWVKETTRNSNAKVLSRRSGDYFYFLGSDSGNPYSGIGDGTTYTVSDKSFTMPVDEWHHLAMTYDDSTNTMKIYYDGVLKENVTVTESLPATSGVKLSLGADNEGSDNFFTGSIDEVRLYNVLLTQGEIESEYERTKPGVTGINPVKGVSGNSVNATITGSNFHTGAAVKLTRSGQTDISGTGVTRVNSTEITCTFDLSGAAQGNWSVVVENLTGQTGTLTDGFEVVPPLSGTYTIKEDMTGDYASISEAITDLDFRGVSGPVSFDVYNGTYEGQNDLTEISGASAANTVTFQEASGQTAVIDGNGDDHCWYLNGADYVTIKGFELTDCRQHGIYLLNDAIHNRISDNYIHGVGTSGGYSSIRLGLDNSDSCDNNLIFNNKIIGDAYGVYLYYTDSCAVYNNMITNIGTCGIYLNRSDNSEVYYNSVYTSEEYCIYKNQGTDNDFKNNIFYNYSASTGRYCIYINGDATTYPFTSDYNDLYAPNGANVGYYSGARNSLSDWQTALPGKDANSLSTNPFFTGATDLYLKDVSPCQAEGTVLAGYTLDYDGDSRDAATPDIGADENTNPVPPKMSGTYTVKQAGGGNYLTISAAIEDLEACGISGSVTIDVYSGTYMEEVDIGEIPGISAINTVIIQEASGETAIVEGDDYVFYLDNTDHVTIKGFDLSGSAYHAVYLDNYARSNIIKGNYIHDCGYSGNYAAIRVNTYCDDNIIANNMILSDYYGIYLYYASDITVAFNSIYNTFGLCIYKYRGTDNIFKNNILYNSSTNAGYYCFYNADGNKAAYTFSSDYNDLYAPAGAGIGYYGGAISTLSDWQTATSEDADSFSLSPQFNSFSDLHIKDASPCQNTGNSVAGINTDYDKEAREASPDIGADENKNPKPTPFSSDIDVDQAGGGDYTTITAAVAALEANGVSAAIKVNVFSGTYMGQVTINEIPGSSAVNTVSIEEKSGETVTVEGDTNVFFLDGADHITIKGFDITGCTEYGIYLNNGSENNNISGNYIYNVGTGGSYSAIRVNTNCDNNMISGNKINGDRYGIYVYQADGLDIYNNMIYNVTDTGFYLNESNDTEFYYNSIYMTDSRCVRKNRGTNNIFKNNIFSQGSSASNDYCFYVQDGDKTSYTFTSDFNDFYVPSGASTGYYNSARSGLSDWQTAVSEDANSIDTNPFFEAADDLHIQRASPCQKAAAVIAGYSTDIDADSRDAAEPDMGADENILEPPVPISGSFDVNGGNNDYPTIIAAVSDLEDNGVNGAVTINVYDGIYMGEVEIGEISGASAVNTITFREETGQTVTVEGDTYVFYLNGADYITIEGFDISNCDQHGIYLYNGANHNTVTGNTISGAGNSGNYSAVRVDENCDNNVISNNDISGDYYGLYLYYADSTKVYNNIIRNPGYYGLYLNRCNDLEFYFNSLYSTTGRCIHKYQGTGNDFKNNIFYQASADSGYYCIYIQDGDKTTYTFTSDYNDFYAPNGASTGYYGAVRTDLSAWQTAVSEDANSLDTNPFFESTSDLHIQDASPCQAQGTAVAGYTDDYDKDARADPPDIGADENLNLPPAPLNGSYDINGGNNDYATILEAIADLEDKGVDGAVTMNVYSGTYTGLHTVNPVSGASSANTITFREETGQTAKINANAAVNALYLDGADYISIEGFEIYNCTQDAVYITNNAVNNTISKNYIHDTGSDGNYSCIYLYNNSDNTVISHNMLVSDYYGIYMRDSDFCDIVFNSVYNTFGRCIYKYRGYSNEFYNNILSNISNNAGDYCFYSDGNKSTYTFTSDYNDFYSPNNGRVGYNAGSACNDLAAWKTSSSEDANSLESDPLFGSSTDLHIAYSSPCQGQGTSLAGHITDYDGDTRAGSPDMGADENIDPGTPMSGTYTVKEDGTGDYFSLGAAVNDLKAKGVSGAVIIDVYSGTYPGQLDITAITGASSANTITIQEAAGQDVTVTGSTYVFHLDGADYITIKGFDITDCTQHGVFLENTATDNTIESNYIYTIGSGGNYSGIYLDTDCDDNVISKNRIRADYYGIYLNSADSTTVDNNMIHDAANSGIRMESASNTKVYFNAVRNDVNNCIYKNQGTGNEFKNNALYQAGSNLGYYCFYVQDGDKSTYTFTSNYNDLYAPSARVGRYGGSRTTLSDWQTATSEDANSLSLDPGFLSSTNLHISAGSNCDGRGAVLAGFSKDLDNEDRESPPDIGADDNLSAPTPMSGTYTVIQAGGGNYTSITAAASDLNNKGVSGAVIIDVYSGTYSGQINFQDIPGASAVNTITIREFPGESVTVDGNTYAFYLDDTDYVTIQGFDITSASEHGIYLINASCFNKITGNKFSNLGTSGNYASIRIDTNCDNNEIYANEIDGDYYGVDLYYADSTKVYNNMIYGTGYYGAYINRCDDLDFYYNSIYNTTGRCLHKYRGTNNDFKNNIFYNTSTNAGYYCIYIQDGDKTTYTFTSDYNDLYAPNGASIGYYGSAQTMFSDWKTTVSEDANSISQNPRFSSSSDLHIDNSSPCQKKADNSTGISNDFDVTDSRDASTPDIGADENTNDPPPPMSGTYDIKQDGTGDYISFASALSDLQALGISGPVIFDVYDDGGTVYSEQVLINDISGADSTNTVTFREAAGETVTVNGSDYGFYLDEADYIIIEGFEITSCDKHGIYASGNAHYNKIKDNYIHDVGTLGNYACIWIDNNCDYNEIEGNLIEGDYYGIYLDYADNAKVYNNMIKKVTHYGIFVYRSDDLECCFNSVSGNMRRCIHKDRGTNNSFKNNILYTTSTNSGHYCFYVADGNYTTYTFDSDYNDFYAPAGAGIVYYGGAYTSLTDWSAASSKDTDSLSKNPRFTSASDLHILKMSPCQGKGTAIAGYTDDYDDQLRADPPDIGADENLEDPPPPMSGTRHINAAGGGDYLSFAAALEDLDTLGVGGALTFEVHSGLYVEEVRIPEITGASAVNTVTFREADGESVTVNGSTYAFELDGADHVTIEGFDITSTTEQAVYLHGSATHNKIKENYIYNIGDSGNFSSIHLDSQCDDNEVSYNRIDGDYWGIYNYRADRTKIYNNMIYNTEATGAYMRESDDVEFYFNSIYADQNHCLYKYRGTGNSFKNNIFYASSAQSNDYCFYDGDGNSAAYTYDSDYNDFYFPNGASCGYYSGAKSSLSDWQASPGKDLNSLAKNPQFTAADNLHIADGSRCQGAGLTIAGYTDDYDQEARTQPDIGADENLNALPPALSGDFDIDWTGGEDYLSFAEAVDDLESRGISGPVVFTVHNGTYVEQVTVGDIDGASAANTITFQEKSGDTVTINGDTYGIYLNGADYVTFDGFDITSCEQHGVYMTNNSSYNKIKNCYISGTGTAGNYNAVRIDQDCDNMEISGCRIDGDYDCLYLDRTDNLLFYNNMVYGASRYSLYLNQCQTAKVYFNSLYNTTQRCVYKNQGDNHEYYNNIFYNTSTNAAHYCFYTSGGTFLSDYNDLYAPNGAQVGYYSGNQTTLEDWNSASGQDDNSISRDPVFVSTDDLHIQNTSLCQQQGTVLVGYTDDYDGDSRNGTSPDIGADENLNALPIPLLTWVGDTAAYTSDGLDPELGNSLTDFIYRVTWTDYGNQAPTYIRVYIDKNGDTDYDDPGEVQNMTAEDAGDITYSDGKVYTYTANITYGPNTDQCSYYFEAGDGTYSAVSPGLDPVALSSAEAINAPDVFITLSVSVDKGSWPIGIIECNDVITMKNSQKITVSNDGDGNETFTLKLTDPADWTSASVAGNEEFVMSGLFCATADNPAPGDFNEGGSEDVLTTVQQTATASLFGYSGATQTGVNVSPAANRTLLLQFKAPTVNTIVDEQSIIITIGCQAP